MLIANRFGRYRLLAFNLLVLTIATASVTPVHAEEVIKAYATDSVIQRGAIIQLADKDKTKVAPLTSSHPEKMKGVVVAASDAPVTLSSLTATRQVFVATSGRYNVLVSNQNGTIKSGDFLAISALEGIAMKSDFRQTTVLGKALVGFTGQGTATANLKNENNQSVNVHIGLIPVDITIMRNPLFSDGSYVPGFIGKMATAIAGKPVSPVRIYSGLFVFLVSLVAVGSILYAGVSKSLIAVGRNPLAKKTISRSLLQVIITGLIILIAGLGAVYLLLKL